MFRLKNAAEQPEAVDGTRILVEPIRSKTTHKADNSALNIDISLQALAPSPALRDKLKPNPDNLTWDEFQHQYRVELARNTRATQTVLNAARHGNVTLVYTSEDPQHNSATVLKEYLERVLIVDHVLFQDDSLDSF